MVSRRKDESREVYLERAKAASRAQYIEHRANNREKLRARGKKYYDSNREKVLACQKQYRIDNRKKICISARKRNLNKKQQVWDYYFNGKAECQADFHRGIRGYDLRILHMHHLNGDGGDHRKEIMEGNSSSSRETSTFYYSCLIKSNFPPLQVMSICPTCHALIHLDEA
jgi:hypothetical protein